MSAISLVLLVGLLNLTLGYALAVQLGYRPRNIAAADQVILPGDEPAEPVDEPAGPTEPAQIPLDELIQELVSGGDESSAWDEEPSWEDSFDPARDVGPPAAEPAPAADQTSTATLLLEIRQQADDHLDWLVDLDTRIRQSGGEHELFTVLAWFEEFKEECQAWLQKGNGQAQVIAARLGELPELDEVGGKLASVAAEHSARLEKAVADPDHTGLKSDLRAAAARLLEEIDGVQYAAHRFRDFLEEAFLGVARLHKDGGLQATDESLRIDPLTRFPNRIGLESILREWWEAGGRQSRPLCAALFDLDGFAEVNATHGLQASDGVVRAMAECLGQLAGENELVVRYGGKRLLLVMFDVGAASAADRAELVRQSIGKTRFVRGQAEIHVTVSGGVAAAQPKETPESVLRRVEAAAVAAKAAGRNCSFLHDGRQPKLIDPAELNVKSREVFV